ncbi:MAG: hypothetical protein R2788_08855 [Saprospiraceae bacterium]
MSPLILVSLAVKPRSGHIAPGWLVTGQAAEDVVEVVFHNKGNRSVSSARVTGRRYLHKPAATQTSSPEAEVLIMAWVAGGIGPGASQRLCRLPARSGRSGQKAPCANKNARPEQARGAAAAVWKERIWGF